MISMELLRDARCVLSPVINLTPMIPAKGFVPDCRFYLKADCLQKTGAFKDAPPILTLFFRWSG